MKYKTIIFDLDGTLLDTLGDLADAVNFALREFRLPERSYEEIRQFVGNGVRNLVLRSVHEPYSAHQGKVWIDTPVFANPDGSLHPQFEEIFACFKSYYVSHCQVKTCLYLGIPELLLALKEKGCKMAIVSNKLQAGVTELHEAYFRDYLDVAIGERPGVPRKPAPGMLDTALEELGSTRDECIYVGDSDVDILTARNSDMPCISVLWGFRDEDFLLEHGATMLVCKPLEILDLI